MKDIYFESWLMYFDNVECEGAAFSLAKRGLLQDSPKLTRFRLKKNTFHLSFTLRGWKMLTKNGTLHSVRLFQKSEVG